MDEHPESKLPRDPEYWERLAARIGDDAAGPLSSCRATGTSWYGVLSNRAPWLMAASAAAILVLWLTAPSPAPTAAPGWIEHALTPREPAGTLVGGAVPPPVDALMKAFPPEAASENGGTP